jgi:flagellar biosynthesis protein FlhG
MTALRMMKSAGSRRMTKTMTFTSGKGGVGKTSLSVNVATALAQAGNRVLVVDGDVSMANLDIFFGVRPEKNLYHVLFEDVPLQQAVIHITPNLDLIPGGSGIRALSRVDDIARRNLMDQIELLPWEYDYLIVDTAPGLDDNVLSLNAAVEEINVIITPDPSSLTDSYALIKVLNRDYRIQRFHVVANQVRDAADGLLQFKRLSDVALRFLNVSLDYRGSIPMDPLMRHAVRQQQMVLNLHHQSPSAAAVKELVRTFANVKGEEHLRGGLQMFWTQLVGLAYEHQDYLSPRAV